MGYFLYGETISDEYFGFTDWELRELMEYYGVSDSYDATKEWYDGYRFGDIGIYCPWDVICHCSKLRMNKVIQPQNYWSNTSSNDAVRRFIQGTDTESTKQEIERLIAEESIRKEIHQELTY